MNPLKHNDNFHSKDSPMRRFRQAPTVLLLAGMVLAAGCFDPVRADEMRAPASGADAGRLVEEVLRKAGGNGRESLGAWSRSIVDRALDRAGGTARQTVPGSPLPSAAPLPAERHAGEISGPRSGTAEILIFTSLSVPAASWRQWARDAARAGAPLVLRGVADGSLPETAKQIRNRLGGAEAGPGSGSPGSGPGQAGAGIAIDPRLFRLFGIERVPAVVVVPGGVPACESRGCADDPPRRMTG